MERVSLGKPKSLVRYTFETFELMDMAALQQKLKTNQIYKFLLFATSQKICRVYLRSGSLSYSSSSEWSDRESWFSSVERGSKTLLELELL